MYSVYYIALGRFRMKILFQESWKFGQDQLVWTVRDDIDVLVMRDCLLRVECLNSGYLSKNELGVVQLILFQVVLVLNCDQGEIPELN